MLRWPKIETKLVDLVGFGHQVAAETSAQALETFFGYILSWLCGSIR